jgi:Dynamin family
VHEPSTTPPELRLSDAPGSGPIPVLSPAQADLLAATERLRQELAGLALPFAVPGVVEALAQRDDALDRLDTFVLPRLRRLDAPLLVVVGGSAGSGKSTLTNSLVGVRVSPEGVLRPTTRAPVLAHHPRDAGAFLSRRILPGLARTTATGAQSLEPGGQADTGPGSIRLVPHWAVAPGLAVIDSPDLNSRVEGNRELARALFGVADLWVFVATPTDYANAAPWELLAEAVERQVSVAVVLNRARESEVGEVRHHFATMLRDTGLASAAFFTVPETTLDDAMIPSWRMVSLHTWLARQVGDAQARDGHVRHAVIGTLGYLIRRCDTLAATVQAQVDLQQSLRQDLDEVLGPVRERLRRRAEDGSLIGPAAEAAWRELAGGDGGGGAGSGGTMRPGRRWTRTSSGACDPVRARAANDALSAGMTAVVLAEASAALARLADRWHGRPEVAGPADDAGLFAVPDDLVAKAGQALTRWQSAVSERLTAGPVGAAPGTGAPTEHDEGTGAAVLVLAAGAEAGWIGAPAQALAELRLNRTEVRRHLQRARQELAEVLVTLVDQAAERPRGLLDELGMGPDRPQRLREAVQEVGTAVSRFL